MKVVVGKGKARVELTGALAGELEQAIQTALGPLGGHIKERAEKVLKGALARWPERTGRSKAGLHLVYRIDPSRMKIEAAVDSDTRYARYIRWGSKRYPRRGQGAKGPPGTVVVAQTVDSSGVPVTIWGPKHPVPPGSDAKRGGVMRDLLRQPMKEQRALLRAELPKLIADHLRRVGAAHA